MTPLPILLATVYLGTGNCSSKIAHGNVFLQIIPHMNGILFLRSHARLKSRLRAAVMWQMHVINKPSFVVCSFQILTGGCWDCGRAWFYCLLRSYKSTFRLCGLYEHVDVAFITNQKWVWLLSDCYVLWKVLVQVLFEAEDSSLTLYVSIIHNVPSICMTGLIYAIWETNEGQ